MTEPLRATVEQLFAALHSKDLAAALACFAEDAVITDPHYPTPRMEGKAALADGLTWAFGTIATFGFTPVKYYAGDDGRSIAVEVDTAHTLRGGMRLRFPQAFVFEIREGRITRLQAYEPYGPPGIGGLILALTRMLRRLRPRPKPIARPAR